MNDDFDFSSPNKILFGENLPPSMIWGLMTYLKEQPPEFKGLFLHENYFLETFVLHVTEFRNILTVNGDNW